MKIPKSGAILIATLLMAMQSVPTTTAVITQKEQVTVDFSPSGTALASILKAIGPSS